MTASSRSRVLSTNSTVFPSSTESCISTWKKLVTNSPAKRTMSPRWTIQSPALRKLISRRLACAATRFRVSTRPTMPPPGNTGMCQVVPGTVPQTKKLRMYAFTAPNTPIWTCARVQATTSTIKSTRQMMVSLRDVSASTIRCLIRGIEVQAPQEVEEVGTGRGDGVLVAEHLDEPGALLGDEDRGEQPALLVAVADEVVDRDRTRLGLDRAARLRERPLVDRAEPDLAAPAVHVRELSARGTRQDNHGDVHLAVHRRLDGGVADAGGPRFRPALGQGPFERAGEALRR